MSSPRDFQNATLSIVTEPCDKNIAIARYPAGPSRVVCAGTDTVLLGVPLLYTYVTLTGYRFIWHTERYHLRHGVIRGERHGQLSISIPADKPVVL